MSEDGAMTLTEFLLARIAEDEAEAREAVVMIGMDRPDLSVDEARRAAMERPQAWPDTSVPCVIVGPARVLAECEAKRRIVEEFGGRVRVYVGRLSENPETAPPEAFVDGGPVTPETVPVLRILAAVYADHPDYDEAWRP